MTLEGSKRFTCHSCGFHMMAQYFPYHVATLRLDKESIACVYITCMNCKIMTIFEVTC